jgi:TPP-dependent pyruvate/acetoin dehydrogenase alpha subunit
MGQLKEQRQLSEADWRAMQAEVQQEIDTAVAFAEASPLPTPEQATEDVFAA